MKKIALVSLLLLLAFSILATGCGSEDSNFPKVTEPYHSDQAIKNGDVVNVHGKYSNIEKWQTFLKNLESNNPDKVRITQYTIEGNPIFYELSYNGKLISYTFDNSMDAFGSDLNRPSTNCKGFDLKKMEDGRDGFVLRGCDNTKIGDTFWFEKSSIN
ncbi:DUF4362 domain-containing protein [Paenibacillus spongiae]|uniref:DUF4362 domain-containing protein n=1 Tax=Paenibacillus spongiae TaxID=2909671 RepID=A0ABY5S3C9_9BACL|nr:DUF4362 domain-containing protein [Paenibacillus spongiae]UVI27340.1 DUF4362 domain-containing protein [Paenibacillus spongiae]